MLSAELDALVRFLYEAGQLKRTPRTGWLLAGVQTPETVAEHSFRTALIGYLLALMEGADPERTAVLCLLHDTQESRIGDIPSVGRRYLTAAANTTVTDDQVEGFPSAVAKAVRAVVGEHEAGTSREAVVARDADKLECLLQAREYQAHGYAEVPPWIDTSAAALRTDAARRLAAVARELPPNEWWRSFVEGHGADRRDPGPGSAPKTRH
jgi:putative hydrolase of HD superfamily